MKLPEGKTRLDLVRQGIDTGLGKRGRLVVGISKVVEDPKNERKTFRNMDGLIASIKAVGVIEPITVTPEDSGTYRIITGHRRFRAAKEAGLEQIEVLIRDPEDERDRRIKSVVSNVQREDIGPVEMAEGLQSLLDEDDQITSQRKLATAIGKDETWVSQMLGILRMPVKLRQKLETSQVSLPYDAVAKVARLKDEEIQKRLINDLLKGATNREIREKIDELKGKKTTATATPKPKQVYSTRHEASVVVQSKTDTLGHDRVVAALEDALQQARNEAAPKLAVG